MIKMPTLASHVLGAMVGAEEENYMVLADPISVDK